jgi:5-methylcytosine-specific restriction endonuclease McrA
MNRRTLQARALKEQGFMLLGRKCASCPSTDDLQIHVHFDDNGAHHKFGSDKRWRFYLACAQGKEATVLCRRCHNRVTTDAYTMKKRLKAATVSPLEGYCISPLPHPST